MENRFNLIDEPWIPVADVGRVSLQQIFSEPHYRALGGNPVQKIALMKLLLAVAQAAATPADEQEWRGLGADGLASRCLEYLGNWHDRFYLYGERPFLQMPAIAAAEIKSYGTVLPEVATGNTTVLNCGQAERALEDPERAVLVVCLMGFALGGKQTDNKIVLSPGYVGKRSAKGGESSGKPGPSVAHKGLLHTVLLGGNLQQSLWLNLLTHEELVRSQRYSAGVGIAPWEQMPAGEDDGIARKFRQSLMGRLVPLCRFCLLADNGLHYSEGIAHPNYMEGVWDPTVAVNKSGREPKALWVNPEKRPWRELTSLLGFLATVQSQGFECLQLRIAINHACEATSEFAVWSGGLDVSNDMGEQRAKGRNDYVESLVWIHSAALGDFWFAQLQGEMGALDELADGLYRRVVAYFKAQFVERAQFNAQAAGATSLLWQLCERDFQQLLDSCDPDEPDQQTHQQARQQLRHRFAGHAQQVYDCYCPKDTARQLDAWARCRPNYRKYLQQEA